MQPFHHNGSQWCLTPRTFTHYMYIHITCICVYTLHVYVCACWGVLQQMNYQIDTLCLALYVWFSPASWAAQLVEHLSWTPSIEGLNPTPTWTRDHLHCDAFCLEFQSSIPSHRRVPTRLRLSAESATNVQLAQRQVKHFTKHICCKPSSGLVKRNQRKERKEIADYEGTCPTTHTKQIRSF